MDERADQNRTDIIEVAEMFACFAQKDDIFDERIWNWYELWEYFHHQTIQKTISPRP